MRKTTLTFPLAARCHRFALRGEKMLKSAASEREEFFERGSLEWLLLGGSLEFHEGHGVGHDDVEIDISLAILRVVEVEYRHALNDPRAHSRDLALERVL